MKNWSQSGTKKDVRILFIVQRLILIAIEIQKLTEKLTAVTTQVN